MAGPRGDMRSVELVEDVPDDRHGAPGRGSPPRSVPGAAAFAASGAYARAGVVLLAAVLAFVLGGSVLDGRREDARLRALAGLPGVVAPLDGPVAALWHERGWVGAEPRDVHGRLVGVVSTPDATVDVVARHPRTGRDVWRTPVGPALAGGVRTDCVVPGAPVRAAPPGAPARPGPVVACLAVDGTVTTEGAGPALVTLPTRVRLVVVDAVDGTVLRDVPVPATSRVRALGADVVLAHVEPDGRGRLERVDARTGAPRWSFTTPEPVPPDRFGRREVQLEAAGDVVALVGGGTWVLSGDDGDVLRLWPPTGRPDDRPAVTLVADGRVVVRTTAVVAGGWADVVDLDRGSSWSAPGLPVRARPDDGSLDDLVLLRRAGSAVLRAHDRSVGALRWGVDVPFPVPPAVLDGRVLAVRDTHLHAFDGRTGVGLWAAPLDRPAQGPLVSDGRVVLVGAPAPGGEGLLTAVGLDDGRERWRSGLDHALVLAAADGHLLGWSARGLEALGPPGTGPAGAGSRRAGG